MGGEAPKAKNGVFISGRLIFRVDGKITKNKWFQNY
jgi:hypothetical protein